MSKVRKLFFFFNLVPGETFAAPRKVVLLFFFVGVGAHFAPSPVNTTQDLTFQLPHRSSQHPQTKRNRMYRIEPKREIKHYSSIITFILFFRFLCITCDRQRFPEYQRPIPESRVENQSTGKDFRSPVATCCRILRPPS